MLPKRIEFTLLDHAKQRYLEVRDASVEFHESFLRVKYSFLSEEPGATEFEPCIQLRRSLTMVVKKDCVFGYDIYRLPESKKWGVMLSLQPGCGDLCKTAFYFNKEIKAKNFAQAIHFYIYGEVYKEVAESIRIS